MQNPLESYRRTQRELRRQFDAFTRENCPTCPTPCCRRPARILPTDILLAESTGWRAQVAASAVCPNLARGEAESDTRQESADSPSPPDLVAAMAGRLAEALSDPPET